MWQTPLLTFLFYVVTVAKAPGGRSKGFGFVEFDTEEAASQAIAALDNAQLDGRAINVKKANS